MENKTFELLHEDVKELKEKVSNIEQAIISIDKTLIVNTASLELHIKRTDLLEEMVKKVDTDLKPVEKHVHAVNTIFKFLAAVGGSISVAYYLISIFKG